MENDKQTYAVITAEQAERIKAEALDEYKKITADLERDFPGITEGMSAVAGSATGGAASLAALSALGVPGLSGAGITSGLAAAGSLVGGGMVAGLAVLAAPVAVLGVGAYAVAKHKRTAVKVAAVRQAIEKLQRIQKRLMENAEFFEREIDLIKHEIGILARKADKKS